MHPPGEVPALAGLQAGDAAGPGMPGITGLDLVNAAHGAVISDDVARLSDAELLEQAASSRDLASMATGRQYRTLAELLRRRRPRMKSRRFEAQDARRDEEEGIGADAPGRPEFPVMPSEEAAGEIALEFTLTDYSAGILTAMIADLIRRLPCALEGLEAGALDEPRVKIIWEYTRDLPDADAAKFDASLSPKAGAMTTGELRDRARREQIRINPQAAEKRRKRGEKGARVTLYANDDHTANLGVENVPAALAAAARSRVSAIARAAKSSGARENPGLLESKTFLGLLLGTLGHIPPATPPEDSAGPGDGTGPGNSPGPSGGAGPGPGSGSGPGDGTGSGPGGEPGGGPAGPGGRRPDPGPGGHEPESPSPGDPGPGPASPAPGDTRPGEPQADSAGGHQNGETMPWPAIPGTADSAAPGCAAVPPGLRPKNPGRIRLLSPWRTLSGTAGEPGDLSWFGAVTPGQALDLACAAASDPAVAWRVIVTDDDGRAIAVTTAGRRSRAADGAPGLTGRETPELADEGTPGLAGGRTPGPTGGRTPGLIEEVTVTIQASLAAALDRDDDRRETARGLCADPDPPLARKLRDIITAANRAAAEAGAQAVLDAEAGGCAHSAQVPGYHVPDTMRRRLCARDRTCRNPVCRRRGTQCDIDHTLAYERGGRTCTCNTGPLCRLHHRLKQCPGWHLEQEPGTGIFTWTTPAGRTYREQPYQYAV